MTNFKLIVICVTIVLSLGAMSSCTYMLESVMNQNYNNSLHKCVEQGGSWIPNNGGSFCIVR
jgi:hypothetical protein